MPVRRHPVAAARQADSLALVPVDLGLVGRLRGTYELLREQERRFVELFYAKLFEAAPQVRSMFPGDMGSQSQKLLAALDTVVRNLEKPVETAALLASLGRRHAGYGARPAHYTLVVALLVDSMREVLGAKEGDARLEEWRVALRLISDQMIAAAEAAGGVTRGADPAARPPEARS